MRRQTLVDAITRLLRDIESSELFEMMTEGFEKARTKNQTNKAGDDNWVSFRIFKTLTVLAQDYGEAELTLLHIFDLERYLDPDFWRDMDNLSAPELHGLLARLKFFRSELPMVINLLAQDHVEEIRNQDSSTPKKLKGMSILSVILVEDDGQFSSPQRLVYALDATTKLYDAIATIESLSSNDLAVLACDSGSDKSFDFLGLAKVMEELRKLIIDIWDRRVFHRQLHMSQCIDNIAKSLPIIEKIESMKRDESLGSEQAEILKRQIIEGTTKFLEAGAHIPEMNKIPKSSPRALMRAEPKLLVGPTYPEDDSTSPSRDDASSEPPLSTEEEELLFSLLAKRRGASDPT